MVKVDEKIESCTQQDIELHVTQVGIIIIIIKRLFVFKLKQTHTIV